MKKGLFFFISFLFATLLVAQDPAKDIKKAATKLASYNLDQANNLDKLREAIQLVNSSIKDPVVQADPAAWQTYGEVYMAAIDHDVKTIVVNPQAPISEPSAPLKAFQGFKKAAELADKSFQVKNAMEALSLGIQNIYYLGGALYQAGDYKSAYDAFRSTYEAYELLKKNNEPTTFSSEESPKSLYYSAVCAQQAGLMDEAKSVYQTLVEAGSNEPGVYEALFNMHMKDNPAEAERVLKLAREKFPNDSGILYAEINYYLAKGELVGLITKLEKALELEPDNTSVYVTLGQVYDKIYQDAVATDPAKAEENFNKALTYYQQAMAKDAKNFDAVYSIGALWYNKAAAYSQELNNLSSDYSAEGNKKYEAKKLQMEEAFNKALPLFLQAEMLMPNDFNTLIALKEIYARQDKLELAEQYKLKIDALPKE